MVKYALAILLLINGACLYAQTPLFRHYTGMEGLAGSTVYYCMQDSKGYIWFCTEAGVNRFDGKHFETFTTADGLADNENFKCFEDSKGRIWFTSYNGRLAYFKDTGFVNEQTAPGLKYEALPGKFLVDIAEDAQHRIWFSAFAGPIYVYDDKSISLYDHDSSWMANQVLLTRDGAIHTIRFMQDSCCLYNLSNRSYLPLHLTGTAQAIYATICKQAVAPGSFYFIDAYGLQCLRGDSLQAVTKLRHLGSALPCFRFIGNDLWLGYPREGVFMIPDFLNKGFNGHYEKLLGPCSVSCIAPDNEGGRWICTLSEGIYYLPGSQSYITNIPCPSVTSIRHQKNTDIWAAGTYNGHVILYNQHKELGRFRDPASPVTRVKVLTWLPDDKLMVGLDYNPYLYHWRTRKTSYMFTEIPAGTADLYQGATGLWMCGRNCIYFIGNDGDTRCMFEEKSFFTNDKLVSIADDNAKGCWFTTVRKLYRMELTDGKITAIGGPEIFHSNLIDLEYINGDLWVATHGNGLFIFRGGKLYRHIWSGNSNITSDICQKVIYDGKGNMWVATNKGISVYNAATYRYLYRLTTNDVLINDDIRDIDFNSGKAYVATPAGISIIDIRRFISATDPPRVYFDRLTAGKRMYHYLSDAQFPYFRGAVTLSYTAITLQASQSLRYMYRMTGKDDGWNETPANQVTFYNLPPGTYTFQVAAAKYNSNWSSPASFTFTILPLWYQAVWFKSALGLMLLVIIYFIYRRQVSSIRKREQEKTNYHKQIVALEGNALASQMNPHFIFNSLNTVQQFILRKKDRQGLDYLSDFSVLIRQILKNSRQPYIDIEDEIDFLKRYMELEQIRFNHKFIFEFKVDPQVYQVPVKIPPMLIQPLLENAVKHGLGTDGGHILIHFAVRDCTLIVTIDDDGPGINAVRHNTPARDTRFESTALKVIESRLNLLYHQHGRYGSLTISDKSDDENAGPGTRAILWIPLKTEKL
ncbi:histidine kinase [Chitinophagaceae bacterium MMS25-I14]